jgi:hypothetical protein
MRSLFDFYDYYGSQHRRCAKKILSLSEFLYEAEIEADPYSLYE